jgi:hypothetical protein
VYRRGGPTPEAAGPAATQKGWDDMEAFSALRFVDDGDPIAILIAP